MTDATLNTWGMRLDLAMHGWKTDIRMERGFGPDADDPRIAFGIWADTMYFRSKIARVCLRSHAIVHPDDDDVLETLTSRVARVQEACHRAVRDFPDTIPGFNGEVRDGRLVLFSSDLETRHAGGPDPRYEPTEALPVTPHGMFAPEGDAHLGALWNSCLSGLHVQDSLNPYFGRSRYASDCRDRDWGYRFRPALRKHGGTRLRFDPVESSIRLLDEAAVCAHIDASSRSVLDLFADFAPGGRRHGMTENGLPPGFRTLAEYRAEEAARLSPASEEAHGPA